MVDFGTRWEKLRIAVRSIVFELVCTYVDRLSSVDEMDSLSWVRVSSLRMR